MSTDTTESAIEMLVAAIGNDPGVELASKMKGYRGIEKLSDANAQRLLVLDRDPVLCTYSWNTILKILTVQGYNPTDTLKICGKCDAHGFNPNGKNCEAYMPRQKYSAKANPAE